MEKQLNDLHNKSTGTKYNTLSLLNLTTVERSCGITNAGAAVVAADHIAWWAGASTTLRRHLTAMLTAQRCTAPDTYKKHKANETSCP